MQCKICSRENRKQPESKYCELHQKAYENLNEKFKVWEKASNIKWKNYLAEVARNPLTGTWAQEVAKNLLSEME